MQPPIYTVQSAEESDKTRWNNAATHPLQSWEWGEFRKRMGVDVVRLMIQDNKGNLQVCQITFHRIPFTPFTVGYIPKGPVPTPFMRDELIRLGKRKRAVFIQLEPDAPEGTTLPVKLPRSNHPLFTKYTFVLDLTKSEEELLLAMHPKTRYNIRVATKHGVTVSQDSSDAAFQSYLSLADETTQRQGFYAHSQTYHRTMWDILGKTGVAMLWRAMYENEPLAAWVLFAWRETLYYPYGASSRNHREVMAPNLLLWEIVRWGKAHGYRRFDLWGALGPNPDPKDPWYGFHRFKEGYHPDLVSYVGSFDLVINPLLYRVFTVANAIRWTFLNLKKRFRPH